jgi:hypothetical protein
MNEEIRKKMLMVLPYLRFAIEEAKTKAGETGAVEIGILVKNADGSGKVLASFGAGEFVEDLATLLGAGPLTEEERQDARAESFISQFGLRP